MIALSLSVVTHDAYSQKLLSDATGLINRLNIQAGGQQFEIVVTANFDVTGYEFDIAQKRLSVYIVSGLESNLAEIIIPKSLLAGNLTLIVDGVSHPIDIKSNDEITFLTINFTGAKGDTRLDITGTMTTLMSNTGDTSYTTDMSQDVNTTDQEIRVSITDNIPDTDNLDSIQDNAYDDPIGDNDDGGGGCLIATAAYGSEMSWQVQHLRELRDGQLLNTSMGRTFLDGVNPVYYSFSPYVADLERENPVFREFVKVLITPMITSLSLLDYVDFDSKVDIIFYGVILVILNVFLYVLVPILVFVYVYHLLRHKYYHKACCMTLLQK